MELMRAWGAWGAWVLGCLGYSEEFRCQWTRSLEGLVVRIELACMRCLTRHGFWQIRGVCLNLPL